MKAHTAVLLFGLALIVMIGCTKDCPVQSKEVASVDCSILFELAECRKENKELRGEIYNHKKKVRASKKKTASILPHSPIPASAFVIDTGETPHTFFQFNPDSYPNYFEYNARTDAFPP